MNKVRARRIDQTHFVLLNPLPRGLKHFEVELEEPKENEALTALNKIAGMLSNVNSKELADFDKAITRRKMFKK